MEIDLELGVIHKDSQRGGGGQKDSAKKHKNHVRCKVSYPKYEQAINTFELVFF